MNLKAKHHRTQPNQHWFLTFLWGVGYLFGFSIVAVLSIWMIQAEDFSVLYRGRTINRGICFERFGNYYLAAEYVAMAGWTFISILIYLLVL